MYKWRRYYPVTKHALSSFGEDFFSRAIVDWLYLTSNVCWPINVGKNPPQMKTMYVWKVANYIRTNILVAEPLYATLGRPFQKEGPGNCCEVFPKSRGLRPVFCSELYMMLCCVCAWCVLYIIKYLYKERNKVHNKVPVQRSPRISGNCYSSSQCYNCSTG